MSKLVEFLAQLGQDSRLSHASHEALQAAMEQAGFSQAARDALVNADRHALEMHAGATGNVCCLVFPAEESDEENDAAPAPTIQRAA